MTAKLGVRWEQQHLVGQVNDYKFVGNWAPRLGFILDPTGSRKTKIFANWGRFFEKIPQGHSDPRHVDRVVILPAVHFRCSSHGGEPDPGLGVLALRGRRHCLGSRHEVDVSDRDGGRRRA